MKLSIEELSFSYRKILGKKPVLCSITGTFNEGVTGILGPNGSGKSTLLNIVTGRLKSPKGSVYLVTEHGRKTMDEYQRNSSIGYLPQRFTFVPGMCVKDTVEYVGWVNGLTGKQLNRAVENSLDVVRLNEQQVLKAGALSGGQRQRLGLACVLVHEPEVMILDEPTTGLDPESRMLMRKCIADAASDDRLVLISTHHMEDLRYLADDVWVIAEGQLLYSGSLEGMGEGLATSDDLRYGTEFEAGYSDLVQSLRSQNGEDPKHD